MPSSNTVAHTCAGRAVDEPLAVQHAPAPRPRSGSAQRPRRRDAARRSHTRAGRAAAVHRRARDAQRPTRRRRPQHRLDLPHRPVDHRGRRCRCSRRAPGQQILQERGDVSLDLDHPTGRLQISLSSAPADGAATVILDQLRALPRRPAPPSVRAPPAHPSPVPGATPSTASCTAPNDAAAPPPPPTAQHASASRTTRSLYSAENRRLLGRSTNPGSGTTPTDRRVRRPTPLHSPTAPFAHRPASTGTTPPSFDSNIPATPTSPSGWWVNNKQELSHPSLAERVGS